VKYDRACLDLADHLFKDGKIDLGDAKQLWEEVEDGPGVTEVEKRTIEKIMADKKGNITAGALKFFNEKLAEWHAAHPSSSSSTLSAPPAKAGKGASPALKPVSPAVKPVAAPLLDDVEESKDEVKEVEMKTTEGGERIELIVDRSSSMRSVLDATVKGLNDFLVQQQAETGAGNRQRRLTVFSNTVNQPKKYREALPTIPPVTVKEVMPSGSTALLDGIGTVLSSLPVEHRSVVVIVTDGQENTSKKFKQEQVNALIAERLAAQWTIVFLAANQDAIATGAKFGLPPGSCATFTAVVDNVIAAFQAAHGLASRSWKSTEQEQRSFTTNERFAMQNKTK